MVEDQDKVIALRAWDIAVRRSASRKQSYALLERADADEAIRALSELETYYLVKELGIESSLPVLSVLEPEQIRALVDLDVWHDDQPDLEDLLLWLEAFRETDHAQLVRAARALDPELLALLWRRRLYIAYIARDDEPMDPTMPDPEWLTNPPESILPLIETPDRRFIIAARAIDEITEDGEGVSSKEIDEESRKLVLELVDLLYKDADFEQIATSLRIAHDDLTSTLESESYRFRNARLEDLGFPEPARAIELYAPIDPDRVLESKEPHLLGPDLSLPALHSSHFARGLFHEVMEAIERPEIVRRIEGELLALSNAAAVADRVEPGDMVRLRDVLDRARAYLELALSHRTDPSRRIEVARERVEQHSVRTLFQAGYGITIDLQRRAKKLRARAAFASGGEAFALVADEERAFLAALEETRPRFSLGGEPRAFSSNEDVLRARGLLEELSSLADALERFGFAAKNRALEGELDPPIAGERNADMLLTTAAANVLLGKGFELLPLDGRDLQRLRDQLDGGRFPHAMVERAVAPITEPAAHARISRGIEALAEALSPLVGEGEIDPRFVGVVVRRVH